MRDRRSLLNLPFDILRATVLLGSAGIAVALIFAYLNIWKINWTVFDGVGSWFKVEEQEPEIAPATLIVQQIRGVSELTTTVFAMETVVPVSQTAAWGNLVVGESRLLYVAYGEVRAGIDLSQLTETAIVQEGDRLIVTLPQPVILDQKIDVEQSRIYDYDRGFLNLGPNNIPELLEFAQRETLNNILLKACDHGILREANEKAEVALMGLLGNPSFGTVEIQTTQPTMCNGQPKGT